MKNIILFLFIIAFTNLFAEFPNGNEILNKIDSNIFSKNQISVIQMTIHGRRFSKKMKVKTWTKNGTDSFSEYLYPPSDRGTKMLKLGNKLWIYNPKADRIIPISGHMLRQSVMGSDLSYEDLMESKKLVDSYVAKVTGESIIDNRSCWELTLTSLKDDVAYKTRKIWVDKKRFIVLKEELYGKSGKLLKKNEVTKVFKTNNRWYPKRMIFKDMLKKGKGTEIIVDSVEFNTKIPMAKFSKAALK